MTDTYFDPAQSMQPAATGTAPAQQQLIPREQPQPEPSRAALVKQWLSTIRQAEQDKKIKDAFRRMREDMQMAFKGCQEGWGGADGDAYVANITLRQNSQKVAALYAKNPRAIARRRPRLDFEIWSGDPMEIQQAQMLAQAAAPFAQVGDPAAVQALAQATLLLQDYQEGMSRRRLIDRVGKTLEIVYDHALKEQLPDFKEGMKQLVRRVETCGVGYVKIGYQRLTGRTEEWKTQVADIGRQLETIERLQADLADGASDPHSADAEQLRLALEGLHAQPVVTLREGLVIDFPTAQSIIVDPACTNIQSFIGADWIAERFLLTADRIKEIYKVDIGTGFKPYTRNGQEIDSTADVASRDAVGPVSQPKACVYHAYQRSTGLVFKMVDGYPDFLAEPGAPDVKLERFWPIYSLVFNGVESEEEIFPPSDVRLMRAQQIEYNRAREGLRQHRIANRPKYVMPAGSLEDEDNANLRDMKDHDVLILQGLTEGRKIDDVLQAIKQIPIDPNLYDVQAIFGDVTRVVGSQEANLGGTSGATATESSIAEGSRVSSLASNVDDLDELLSALARDGGQILLREMSPETAKRIAGRGAAWPELSTEDIVEEVYLEIEAGSSGRPNKAAEIADFERMAPFLVQVPGINPQWMAREAIRRLDDRIELEDAIAPMVPSITAMNQQSRPGTGDPATDPNQQGGEGGTNARRPQGQAQGPQPAMPAPSQPAMAGQGIAGR